MVPHRRHIDAAPPDGVTSVLLVAGPTGRRSEDVATACREALRETDAVLERQASGVTAVLLRHLRPGADDIETVARRVRLACESAVDDPVRVGVAVAETDDEPLDVLLNRAQQELDRTEVTPTG